jgi:hypothetical protein
MIKVIEDFLPTDQFEKLRDELLSPEFPWYITPDVAFGHKDNEPDVDRCDDIYNWQLIHNFYNTPGTMSEAIKLMNPVLEVIKANVLLRIKANLTPRADKIVQHGMHVDVMPPIDNVTTGVLYLNTNNGYTVFEDGQEIPSIENTFVTFPCTWKHTGTTCTDQKYRALINFNYIKVDDA